MAWKIITSPRAIEDLLAINSYLSQHSRQGAERWQLSYDEAVIRLLDDPEAYPALENSIITGYVLRRFTFSTKRGRTYYGIFIVLNDEVRILRVRAPGQNELQLTELD